MDRSTERLVELEWSLWSSGPRSDVGYLDRVLAEDFLEFGRSGRTYDRASIMADTPVEIDADLDDLSVRLLSQDVALVTYRSILRHRTAAQVSNRASVWRHDGDRWRLEFHQGTPTTP